MGFCMSRVLQDCYCGICMDLMDGGVVLRGDIYSLAMIFHTGKRRW